MHIPVSPDIRRNEDYVELEDLRAKNCAPERREMKAVTISTRSMWMPEIRKTVLEMFPVYHGTHVTRRRLSETCAVEKCNTRRILRSKGTYALPHSEGVIVP